MDSPYLTKAEALAYLKVSRFVLEKLVRQGLPCIKLDRRLLFRRTDIDNYMASRVTAKKR